MNAANLEREIRAYEAMLPELQKQHGAVWAVVAQEKLIQTFTGFADAARFVNAHHADGALIRHTNQHKETAPFVEICA